MPRGALSLGFSSARLLGATPGRLRVYDSQEFCLLSVNAVLSSVSIIKNCSDSS